MPQAKVTSPYFLFLLLFSTIHFSQHSEFMLGGIQINEPDPKAWVNALKEVDFNTVEATVYAKQGNWNSSNLWWNTADTSIVREIRIAKKEGLKVVLILRVALDHAFEANTFLWHGMIFSKEPEITQEWFNKYSEFAQFWSKIAEKENVDVFVIGSEMNALTSTTSIDILPPLEEFYLNDEKQTHFNNQIIHFENELEKKHLWSRENVYYETLDNYLSAKSTANKAWANYTTYFNQLDSINTKRDQLSKHWLAIIQRVRKDFSGKLSYAANFDNYNFITFWKELDFIGINAYFSLKKMNTNRKLETILHEAWLDIFQKIDCFKIKNNYAYKPIIFTELGFTSKKNCTIQPWNSHGFSVIDNIDSTTQLLIWQEQPDDKEERNIAVDALYKAKIDINFNLQGILYWKLSSIEEQAKHEPFMLSISKNSKDPLLKTLRQFYSD